MNDLFTFKAVYSRVINEYCVTLKVPCVVPRRRKSSFSFFPFSLTEKLSVLLVCLHAEGNPAVVA